MLSLSRMRIARIIAQGGDVKKKKKDIPWYVPVAQLPVFNEDINTGKLHQTISWNLWNVSGL